MSPDIIHTVVAHLDQTIHQILPKSARCQSFGGAVNGLSTFEGDIDSTILIDEEHIGAVEQKCAEICLENLSTMTDYNQQFAEYAHVLEQMLICQEEVNDARRQGEYGIINQELLTRRDKWRKAIILLALTTVFDRMEIEDVVLRARVPILKLHLYLDQRQK